MGFRFRLGKHKNKLISLLLILSILVSVVSFHPLETRADNNIVYSYYDWLYSVAKSQGYEMKWIDPEHCDYPATSKALALTFQYIDHKLGLYGPLDNYDPVENLKVNLEDIAWYFKSGISRMTEEGIYLTSEAWEAFKQFFDHVSNNTLIGEKVVSDFSDADQFRDYISQCTGGEIVSNFYVYDYKSLSDYISPTNFVVRFVNENGYSYGVLSKSRDDATFFNTSYANGSDGYFGWKYKNSSGYWEGASYVLSFSKRWSTTNYDACFASNNSFFYVGNGVKVEILGANGCVVKGTSQELYSPYIKYTSTGTAPAQVPDIIPWSTFPDHEVTDDDTKIYIPVESPEEETPTETPEEPTETPEQPTETPEEPTETPDDSDDGDDITNLVPIFPDIDIDPDIHLPDDWINPPDIDLDPDVDVDTPSPGGKIPHLQKLKEKFPFCIPFDLVLLFKMLNKKPKAPKWEFKHDFQIGDSKPYTWEVVVDMADYDKYVQIFREGFFLLFLVGLFFVTKKLISWQTG